MEAGGTGRLLGFPSAAFSGMASDTAPPPAAPAQHKPAASAPSLLTSHPVSPPLAPPPGGHLRTASASSSLCDTDSDAALAQALHESLNLRGGDLSALAASSHLYRSTSSSPASCSSPGDRAESPAVLMEEEDAAEKSVTTRLSSTRLSITNLTPRTSSLSFVYNPADFQDHITEDRQRVLDRLGEFDLCEYEVLGDGNCQFRSLSDQLFRSPRHYKQVRRAVIKELRARPQLYSPYVPGSYKTYCAEMAKDTAWGDNITLQATSNHYGTRITLITSYAQEFIIQIEPSRSRTNRTLYLSFWAEVHYNSISPASDPPRHAKDTPPPPPPKLLGSRKLGQLARNIGIQEHHD
mmetsp:Transcript_47406/g.121005  ORF Transcript_47406/g.121005 Transcript_47406/m.121005 type:complete len:351 (-) Transcript_47406:158-1210(-)